MADHGARGHAEWSASATDRNWNCAGALALNKRIKRPEKENPAAAWGTACHQVSEKCLRGDQNAASFIDTVERTKEHKIDVDEELAVTAQFYVDYVRGRIAEYDRDRTVKEPAAVVAIEQNFSLTKALNAPFGAGGTGDCVIFFPKWRLIEIIDLKGGRGVIVEVKNNKQLRTYGLGAVIENSGLDIEKVMSTVVQPRADHKDGRIRSETIHVADLGEWTADLLAAMRRAKQADLALTEVELGKASQAQWNAEFLKAGDHCKFCRSAGTCPAIEQRATDAVGLWFDDLDKPQLAKDNNPQSADGAKLARWMDTFDMISEWMNAVRAEAHTQAESGVEIYDPATDARYQLVEKIGNRKWIGEEEDVRKALFLAADLTDDEMHNKKLKSPAQIEKVLGAKRKKLVDPLVERPVTGTNLVRTTKTTREAATPAVQKHFSPIPD